MVIVLRQFENSHGDHVNFISRLLNQSVTHDIGTRVNT